MSPEKEPRGEADEARDEDAPELEEVELDQVAGGARRRSGDEDLEDLEIQR